MANTYYNSQLTGEEIEAALEAVSGLIVPANNGKIVAIDSGTLVAKSATEYTDFDLQDKTVTPGASQQVVTPDSGYDGLSSVTVNGDADLIAGNIKKDVEIFGVTGTFEGGSTPVLQQKTANPGASQQTIQPDSGYDGLSSVIVNGDADLVAGNIKKNVEIFGVTGTYEGSGGGGGGSGVDFYNEHIWDDNFYIKRSDMYSISYTFDTINGKLAITWLGGVYIAGSFPFTGICTPGDFQTLHYKMVTGSRSYDQSARFAPFIGIKPISAYSSAMAKGEVTPDTSDWIQVVTTTQRDTTLTGSIDLTGINQEFFFIMGCAGWDVEFSEVYFT